MKVVLAQVKTEPKLHWPRDLKPGTVYTWGSKAYSYLRVDGGSVILGDQYAFLSQHTHDHFKSHPEPFVEIATEATLTLNYEV